MPCATDFSAKGDNRSKAMNIEVHRACLPYSFVCPRASPPALRSPVSIKRIHGYRNGILFRGSVAGELGSITTGTSFAPSGFSTCNPNEDSGSNFIPWFHCRWPRLYNHRDKLLHRQVSAPVIPNSDCWKSKVIIQTGVFRKNPHCQGLMS